MRWWNTDVTFDLFAQIARRERTVAAWWDWFRWRRFEALAVRAARRVVVMSPKDAEMLGPKAAAVVIENGVDLERFQPVPERQGSACSLSLLSPLPNIAAYRFFTERVWPLLRDKFPQMELTVVCGPITSPTGAPSPIRPSLPRTRASGCWASSPTSARSTAKPTSSLCPPRFPPAPT